MDPEETARLMRIILANQGGVKILPKTRDELLNLGVASADRLAAMFETETEETTAESVLCCTTIAPGEMLTVPDNKTARCDWLCGRTIQYRPWVPGNLQKVCLYCAAERGKTDN